MLHLHVDSKMLGACAGGGCRAGTPRARLVGPLPTARSGLTLPALGFTLSTASVSEVGTRPVPRRALARGGPVLQVRRFNSRC